MVARYHVQNLVISGAGGAEGVNLSCDGDVSLLRSTEFVTDQSQ